MLNIVIVGGGKVGSNLARILLENGHMLRIIEKQRSKISRLQQEFPSDIILWGNGTDPSVLESAGIGKADVLAAVTSADETNLVVSGLGRFEFGVPRTIARVKDPSNAWIFTPEMGVDAFVNQADLMAHLIAEEMSIGEMMTLLKLRKGDFSLVEQRVHAGAPAVGKAVKDLNLPRECAMVAIIRDGKLLIPRGDTTLIENDEVLLLLRAEQLSDVAKILGIKGPAV